MIFFPAIDIKEGQCVRLLKGDMNSAKVFHESPVAQAIDFESQGAKWIHIVDLNGAFCGKSINSTSVQNILSNISIPVQIGGGIRSIETIESWLSRGVKRVILGTIALENPSFVVDACKRYPGKIAVGIDTNDGRVATDGWAKTSNIFAIELAQKFEDSGVSAIIHTDISRDGMMMGPNIESTLELAKKITIPVILSGGISSHSDLSCLLKEMRVNQVNLGGVISGRAVYDGKIDITSATNLCLNYMSC